MKRMARRTYRPAITRYAREVAESATALAEIGLENEEELELAGKLKAGISEIVAATGDLHEKHMAAQNTEDMQKRADKYANEVVPAMARLRTAVDEMEIITCRDYWPVPSYNNVLFYV